MSDTDGTSAASTDSDLGPMPDAEATEPEPNPGGVDAIPQADANIPADLDPSDNAAVDETAVPELVETEDTDTEATKGDGSEDVPAEEESPA